MDSRLIIVCVIGVCLVGILVFALTLGEPNDNFEKGARLLAK
ncbi:MAG: hypothetical protein ACPGJH_03630 [Alphaproteobacteria bacterium]